MLILASIYPNMLRAFDHICMEKARYKFLIILIIIIIEITNCVERFSMTWKQDSPDPGHLNCFSPKKNWIFIESVFKRLHSLSSVGRENLVWMCEITILGLQAWDSHIMCESWQV